MNNKVRYNSLILACLACLALPLSATQKTDDTVLRQQAEQLPLSMAFLEYLANMELVDGKFVGPQDDVIQHIVDKEQQLNAEPVSAAKGNAENEIMKMKDKKRAGHE